MQLRYSFFSQTKSTVIIVMQPTVGDELWLVKSASETDRLRDTLPITQRTVYPSFSSVAAKLSNDERVRLGGKYCATGGWTPGR